MRHRSRNKPRRASADRHDRRGHHCRGRDRGGCHPLQQIRGPHVGPLPVHLPTASGSYLGVFTNGVPTRTPG